MQIEEATKTFKKLYMRYNMKTSKCKHCKETFKHRDKEYFSLCPDCEDDLRLCDECGTPMKEGFVISGGEEYYCNEKCLHKHFTKKEFLELYDDGNGDSYWTEWESFFGSES